MAAAARIAQRYEYAVPVAELHEHPDNPNRGDVEAIGESMAEHGFYGAVYAQEGTGTIVAGNHRYRTAVERGEPDVPVIWLQVDDDRGKRILLVDNGTAAKAERDAEAELELLRQLAATDRGLAGTGYSDDEYAALLAEHQVPDFDPTGDDEQPRLDTTAPKTCPKCGFEWRDGAGGEVIPA